MVVRGLFESLNPFFSRFFFPVRIQTRTVTAEENRFRIQDFDAFLL